MRLRLFLMAGVLCGPAFADIVPPPAPGLVSCNVPFDKDTTEAQLIETFGKENVEYKTVPGAEGMETNATVVYPNDPARMLTIYWWDEDKRARPAAVTIQADFAADPDGNDPWKTDVQWQTAEGLKIGSTLEDVQAANGKPFVLSGFGWDYGGFAIGWEGGKLDAAARGDCNLLVRLQPSSEETPDTILGDVEIKSDAPEMAKAAPRVTELSVSYPSE